MSTAAVIGRQLRHHQPTNRVPGPVVPPTHYRGRSNNLNLNNSNNHNHNNDHHNLANNIDLININVNNLEQGADPESKFAKFSHQYNHSSYEYYPHPAHRENNQNQNKNQNKNDKRNLQKLSTTNNNDTDEDQNQSNDQWVFSKHCFCVAFKALSTGVILFLIGTIMSILGFFADRLSMESIRLNNGTYIMSVNNNTKSHLHNMTYVGPVIMGLGFIVIIAACVLTFEVRDTLGIRDDPKNRKKSTTTTTTTNQQQSDNKTNNDSIVTISNNNNQRNYSKNLKSEKKVISAPIIEETLSKNQSINHDHNNNNNNDNRLSMIKTDSNILSLAIQKVVHH
uniref:Uncharacterized protein n=1 Tax=Dermatophagoides pteronyssinus TaxID=6956 RepID=A0A6P6Y7Z4_DERPT|nr:putative uncharacterized protein DDB_G0277255 isoform X1 [Dermatophagoides pteronyssinus]